jgi:hypothetical protein
MNEEIRKKILFSALGLAIIYGAYNFWPTKDSRQEADQFPAIAKIAERPEGIRIQRADLIDIEKLEPLPWGNDPFHGDDRKNRPVTKGSLGWVLTGIIYDEDAPVAIINNKPVGVGESIGNAKVITIERKQVIIKNGNKEITLTVTKS